MHVLLELETGSEDGGQRHRVEIDFVGPRVFRFSRTSPMGEVLEVVSDLKHVRVNGVAWRGMLLDEPSNAPEMVTEAQALYLTVKQHLYPISGGREEILLLMDKGVMRCISREKGAMEVYLGQHADHTIMLNEEGALMRVLFEPRDDTLMSFAYEGMIAVEGMDVPQKMIETVVFDGDSTNISVSTVIAARLLSPAEKEISVELGDVTYLAPTGWQRCLQGILSLRSIALEYQFVLVSLIFLLLTVILFLGKKAVRGLGGTHN